jgi:hypothetical protein
MAKRVSNKKPVPPNRKVKIMVGSTVYGFEDQLSQIVAQLNTLGYEVLNSHYGSIKVNPHLTIV